MKYFKGLIGLARFGEWLPILQSNIIFAIAYLLLSETRQNPIVPVLLFIAFNSLVLLHGFITNSIADRAHDSILNRNNGLSVISTNFAYAAVAILSLFILFATYSFISNLFLGLLTLFFSFFYSHKPLRFKENGILGPISASLATTLLPFVFLIYASNADIVLGFYIALALFTRQTLFEMTHQLDDLDADKSLGVKTIATTIGGRKMLNLTKAFSAFFVIVVCLAPIFWPLQGIALVILFAIFSIGHLLHIFRSYNYS